MQLTSLALLLATAISSVAAYPIKADGVNCRSGPGTSYKVVKTYAKGHDVKLTCQAYGENINGDSLWDKTTDGCYVADYYVKTGTSSMVTGQCGSSGGGSSGGSTYNGKITRKEIIDRANYWVSRHVPYSMSKTYPDPQGRKYRTELVPTYHPPPPFLNRTKLTPQNLLGNGFHGVARNVPRIQHRLAPLHRHVDILVRPQGTSISVLYSPFWLSQESFRSRDSRDKTPSCPNGVVMTDIVG